MFYISSSTYPQKLKYITAKGDSAASGHYWRDEDAECLKNVKNQLGPQVTLPNNSSIQATKQGHLPLDLSLSKKATSTAILPSLKSASLVSLGQLCDDDCEVLLNKKKLTVSKNNKEILHGDRNRSDGLWDIKIPYYEVYKRKLQSDNFINPPTHAAMYIANNNSTTTTTVTQETNKKSPIKYIFIDTFKGLEEVVATSFSELHPTTPCLIDL